MPLTFGCRAKLRHRRRLLQPKYMLLAMMTVLILGSWLDKRYPALFEMSTWLEHLGLGELRR